MLPSHQRPDTRHKRAKREEIQEIQEVEKQLPQTVSQGQSTANSPVWRAESSLSPVPPPWHSTINKTINELSARIWQCSRALTGHSEGDPVLSLHLRTPKQEQGQGHSQSIPCVTSTPLNTPSITRHWGLSPLRG